MLALLSYKGLTLATEDAITQRGPIFISALLSHGLAERTRTVQVGDQLVEVDGREVANLSLPEVVPLLQETVESETTIRLKLARYEYTFMHWTIINRCIQTNHDP